VGIDPVALAAVSVEAVAVVVVVLTILAVRWLGRQQTRWIQRVLDWFPAILFAYVIPAVFTHAFSVDLSRVSLHDLSRNWIIPVTILTVMSSLSLQKLREVGVKPLVLFFSGSLAIATLAPLLVLLSEPFIPASREIFIEKEYWRGLIPMAGSWIGGSTSQLVLKELARCPESLFLSVLVLDNILVNAWTILMFQIIKRSDWISSRFGIRVPRAVPTPPKLETETAAHSVWLTTLIILVGTTVVVVFIEDFLYRVLALSVLGLVFGNVVPKWSHTVVLKAGGLLIIAIMSILGLRLDFNNLSLPLIFVGLCILWILGHFVFMVIIAKALGLHMAWVPIASMANVGGISTAPAVAAAYSKQLMPHAILLAILSMVTSNLWGLLTIYLFQVLP